MRFLMNIHKRLINNDVSQALINKGFHPKLAILYAARDIKNTNNISYELENLIPPTSLLSANSAAKFLAKHIDRKNTKDGTAMEHFLNKNRSIETHYGTYVFGEIGETKYTKTKMELCVPEKGITIQLNSSSSFILDTIFSK